MRPSRRSVLALIALLAFATACAGGTREAGDDELVMTVAAPTVTDIDDYVAKTKGFYEARGVTVRRVQTGTAAQSVQLLATGEANIGRGLANAIQARLRTSGQLDFVDVADTTVRPPYVMESMGIHEFAALEGTAVGITSVTDQGTIVTAQMIDRLGLDADRIDLVPTGGTASRVAAMNAGGVQSSLLLPPQSFTAEEKGATRMGYLPELFGPDYRFSFTGIVVRASWAEAHRDQLVRYLAARGDALRWLHDPANAEEAAQILAKETKIPVPRARETYDLILGSSVQAFADEIAVDIPAGRSVLEGLRVAGLTRDRSARIEDFVDDSYAAQAREMTS